MRNGFLYALFVLLFLAALWFTFSHTSPQGFLDSVFAHSYKYKATESGITFASDVAPPTEVLSALAQRGSFVLVLHGEQGQTALNSAMANALIDEQIVLTGHKKATTTIVMVFDKPNGTWINCQTDYGTGQQNVTISKEECTTLFSPSNSVVWEIQFPNPNKSGPLVELSADRIMIFPKESVDIVPATFLTLKIMFSDATELIGLTNSTIGQQQTPQQISDSNTIPATNEDTNSDTTVSA